MTAAKKIWSLLAREQRFAAIVLLGLTLGGAALETLGIGLVVPALAIMARVDLGSQYPALVPWLERMGNPSHEKLIIAGMLLLVFVFAVKSIFLAFLTWRQASYVYGLQVNFSQRLFAGYMQQPYTFHLQRNSAELIRNTIGQVSDIVQGIQQGIALATEALVLMGISILLLMVEPLGALLVVCSLGIAGWGFNHFTRKYMEHWGVARQYHEGKRIQHLQQGLGGIKDALLLGREGEFLGQYYVHNLGTARVAERQITFLALPRLWLEFLAIGGLAVLVIVMIGQGKPVEVLLPTLGLFAAAAFRILPSVSRMLGAIQIVRFSKAVIDTLHEEFLLLGSRQLGEPGPKITFHRELMLTGISYQYPSANKLALRNISLSIPRGATVGFVGGSGSGKSTLIDIILGLIRPDAGSIMVDGVDIRSNLRSWQNQIGYVQQSIYLTDDTLRRNIAFGLPEDQIDDGAIWKALEAAQLEQYVRELPEGLNTIVGERGVRLSGGQRQRIGIARALYHDPQVLVLDEATSSLDTATERSVMEAVYALHGSKTILIVAHRLSTVERCDCLFRLEKGELIEEGTTRQVLENIQLIGARKS